MQRGGSRTRLTIVQLAAAVVLAAGSAGMSSAGAQAPRPGVDVVPAGDGREGVRGVVKPLAEAQITSDLARRIQELPWRDGDRFRKGDLLIRFDCRELQAEANAARAVWRGKKLAHTNAAELHRRQAAGALAVAIAAADADKAEADAQALEARLDRCTIAAPFDGRIVERLAAPYETPTPSQPILRIVDDSALEIQIIVPSRWLKWIREGLDFTFRIDETGEPAKAKVRRIGASVDPVSQTVRIAGEFVTRSADVLGGMSGTAVFEAAPHRSAE